MSDSISFEEFQTERLRQRAVENGLKNQREEKPDKIISKNQGISSIEEKKSVTFKKVLGEKIYKAGILVESIEVQTSLVVLIWLDLIATATSIAIHDNSFFEKEYTSIAHQFLQSFSSFALIVFILDLQILNFTFGIRSVLSHPGYMLDCFVIIVCLYSRISSSLSESNSILIRFIAFLRVWRIARLFSSAMDILMDDHKQAQAEIYELEAKIEQLTNKSIQTEQRLKQEREAKNRVEKVLQGYKDEAETLAEALEIAAYDVAVTMAKEQESIKKENAFIDERGDEFYDGQPEIKEEEINDNLPVTSKESRIVVHSDGTFETKQEQLEQNDLRH